MENKDNSTDIKNSEKTIEDLNKNIEKYISLANEVKELEDSIKATREKIKEISIQTQSYRSLIEDYLINNGMDSYTFQDYRFGIVERKKTKKPDKDEIHDIIYNEIKDKITKKDVAVKTTEKIMNNMINGGETERVKKINVKKIKEKQTKSNKIKKTNKKDQ